MPIWTRLSVTPKPCNPESTKSPRVTSQSANSKPLTWKFSFLFLFVFPLEGIFFFFFLLFSPFKGGRFSSLSFLLNSYLRFWFCIRNQSCSRCSFLF
ncbi:hypothetical protein M747DRAFT_47112 [Aspergillus niger ATCC 13496]|uniref:Uncharacterized protein n=1 Tax=Aspergillus niger ATCC 13496 TaxID=1353008 RepID=A0A370BXF0_ASPNG|nr:hypothetical protein M747DRAFT_47112 [Aspergillus niger ATCC 13496]